MAKKKEVSFYDIRPLRKYEWEENDDKTIAVRVPRFDDNKVGRWIMSKMKKPYIRISLDDYGSHVWKLCDGKNTITDIAHSLKDEFGDHIEPVYDRLELFIKQLHHQRYITVYY